MNGDDNVDVLVVGGGPAGVAAALVLARTRRKVLVVDDGTYRNRQVEEFRGFPGRDATDPASFRQDVWVELARYGVNKDSQAVKTVATVPDGLTIIDWQRAPQCWQRVSPTSFRPSTASPNAGGVPHSTAHSAMAGSTEIVRSWSSTRRRVRTIWRGCCASGQLASKWSERTTSPGWSARARGWRPSRPQMAH